MDQSTSALERFRQVLRSDGVDAALGVLNEGVAHRYTGIFLLRGDELRNMHFFDKQRAPRSDYLDVVPFSDSFCQIAMREGKFESADTATDARVDYSPYKGVVVSYQGVPLLDDALALSGTLCHFDSVEQAPDESALALLYQAARILPPHVTRPA
ncbi:guanylate cyclase [Pseudorhodoferax sp.]|uniref:guanylate cyclase n=1 Tax=Pseudorhodoferax sp. TaxID=1993553 RepID=UPI002DD68F24|nr:guanylate cyclase [Pseudorhodoferax sp.]